jgi:hypothetical protein
LSYLWGWLPLREGGGRHHLRGGLRPAPRAGSGLVATPIPIPEWLGPKATPWPGSSFQAPLVARGGREPPPNPHTFFFFFFCFGCNISFLQQKNLCTVIFSFQLSFYNHHLLILTSFCTSIAMDHCHICNHKKVVEIHGMDHNVRDPSLLAKSTLLIVGIISGMM